MGVTDHFVLESVVLNDELLGEQDCVVLVTDHDAFDYELIGWQSRLIVDTRGRLPKDLQNLVCA